MKAILMSIQPKWCAKIESGVKTIEVRKTRPKIETPFKCYIYCTNDKNKQLVLGEDNTYRLYDLRYYRKIYGEHVSLTPNGNGKVIGEFVCDEIIEDKHGEYADVFYKDGLLTFEEQKKYGKNNPLYGWYISDLKIYDKPKGLGEFYRRLSEKVLEEGDYDCRKDENVICLDYWDGGGEVCQDCPYGGKVYLTRPPQSWCYVEELEE